MIVAVLCYLAAFTATSMDFLRYSELVWKVENTDEQVTSNMCRPLKWDYVTEAGELLILCFGLQLAIASRNANTQFRVCHFDDVRIQFHQMLTKSKLICNQNLQFLSP